MNTIQLGVLPHTEEIIKFRESQPLVEGMQRLLSAPEFAKALAVLKTATEPRVRPTPVQGNHPDTIIAEHYFLLAGANQMLGLLQSLALPFRAGKQGPGDEEEFTHALPPEYQQEPKKP